jgi:ABC-type nickel/cobalt efflux system permease component RcnA
MAAGRLEQSDADAILPVSIGTVVWAVVLIGLLIAKPTLDANGTTWWIGAAAVGFVSGVGGVVFLRWRKARALRRSSASTAGEAVVQE